ncbi:hypothetical protein CS022_11780 [Veronia nyctiphanis]|uniref:MotA/TolQ/ExbB proton channel domain-containing protein n=2 Tax=Veronia nyctiphanis TaxID=1278244 RepID=A0A4Q0YVI8_9GAMM|nr:MotA/TolQ/ExbB proton channel family protein [Veronia nyctiphanis]RXJ73179.1 hypothetical protein CS022_11780 [Veronia nyctiphanis]
MSLFFRNFIDHWWHVMQDFMSVGGPVLWWLAAVALVTWVMIIERLLYVHFSFPAEKKKWVNAWLQRSEHCSWKAKAIRDGWLFVAQQRLNQNLRLIRGMVSICPMLGLLGTVTGMIAVFDVMALQGNTDARSIAGGIALATFPTLGGMVIALAGVFAHSRLVKKCERKTLALEKELRVIK